MASGRPKYDDTSFDYSVPHILKAPYQSVAPSRTEYVDTTELPEIDSSEYLAVIGRGSNQCKGVEFQRGLYDGRRFSGSQSITRAPQGGVQYIPDDVKLPEEYYPDNRRAVRYVELPENITHNANPILPYETSLPHRIRLAQKISQSLVPTAVYSRETLDLSIDSRKPVYKGTVSISGLDSRFKLDVKGDNSGVVIRNKAINTIIPSVYSPYIRINDTKIPIKLKDPNYTVMQIAGSDVLSIPTQEGEIRLKDYQWTVVQNVDSEYELIIDIPVDLKERPENSVVLSQISSLYTKHVEKQEGRIVDKISTVQNPFSSDGSERYVFSQGHNREDVEKIRTTITPMNSSTYGYVEKGSREIQPSKIYTGVNVQGVVPGFTTPQHQVVFREKPMGMIAPEVIKYSIYQ